MNEPIGCALCGGNDHNADECKRLAGSMRQRFDEIEREIMEGKHTAQSVFTQMRTAAIYRAAQPAPVVPEGVTIERDMMGAMHIKLGDFDFIQIQYQYPHTDNASTRQLAERIAAMLTAAAPAQGQQVEFGDAYQGAREDLAIWKRRALEAEEKLRQQGSIIDHLTLEAQGETRMGEPRIAQGQQSPNYWRDLAVANRKVADEALAELSALKAQQVGQEPVAIANKGEQAFWVKWTDAGKDLRCPGIKLYTTPQPAPAQDVAGSIMLSQEGAKILAEAIGAHAYVLGALVNGRPDLAMNEAKKWVDGFMDAGSSVTAHDKQSGEVKP